MGYVILVKSILSDAMTIFTQHQVVSRMTGYIYISLCPVKKTVMFTQESIRVF